MVVMIESNPGDKMNIYFSCSITGGRDDQAIYYEIVRLLQEEGHEIPTAHLASSDLDKLERNLEPEDVFKRDISWVRACDAIIAEVSTPSHGVGYEIAEAVNKGKPALCLYRSGVKISKIISGNTEKNVVVRSYSDLKQMRGLMIEFLSRFQ